jgi:hypothetical protein
MLCSLVDNSLQNIHIYLPCSQLHTTEAHNLSNLSFCQKGLRNTIKILSKITNSWSGFELNVHFFVVQLILYINLVKGKKTFSSILLTLACCICTLIFLSIILFNKSIIVIMNSKLKRMWDEVVLACMNTI